LDPDDIALCLWYNEFIMDCHYCLICTYRKNLFPVEVDFIYSWVSIDYVWPGGFDKIKKNNIPRLSVELL